jgi:hypothetical protein
MRWVMYVYSCSSVETCLAACNERRTSCCTFEHSTNCSTTATSTHANPADRSIRGLLYFVDDTYRLYVPDDRNIKADILQDHHEAPEAGHPGNTRMLHSLKRYYYWPLMYDDIRRYTASCRHCQLHKPNYQPAAAPMTFPLPKHPFEEIALDWVGPLPTTPRHFDFLLNITDRLTKYAIAIPCCQSMTRVQLADALYYHVFCTHGVPQVIISDRDRRIDNEFFKQLSARQGTSHRLTVSHRPQGNGQAESLNKELVTKLRMYASDLSRAADWDLTVKECVYAYNTSVHSAHGFTPFFLLHGYHPSSLYTLYWPSSTPPYPSTGSAAEVADFQRRHHECLQLAHRRLTDEANQRASHRAAPIEKQPFFKVGDLVRVSTKNLPRDPEDTKFTARFTGPFEIIGNPSPQTYQIDFGLKYPGVSPFVNVQDLRPYVQPSASKFRSEADEPQVGSDHVRPIEAIVSSQRARGRPSRTTGPTMLSSED